MKTVVVTGLEDAKVIRNGYNKLVLPRMAKVSPTSRIFGEFASDVENFETTVKEMKATIVILDEVLPLTVPIW